MFFLRDSGSKKWWPNNVFILQWLQRSWSYTFIRKVNSANPTVVVMISWSWFDSIVIQLVLFIRSRRNNRPIGQIKFVHVVFETNQKPFLFEYRLGFQDRQVLVFVYSYLFLECRLGFRERQVLVFVYSYLFLMYRLGYQDRQVFGLHVQVRFSR